MVACVGTINFSYPSHLYYIRFQMGMLILQSQSQINLYFFSIMIKLHINMEILIKKAQCELPLSK